MTRASGESRIASGIAWGLLALSLADWWTRVGANVRDFREQAFNADYLVWPAVIEDVLVRGNAFVGHWRLPPAPYLVPDAALFTVARLLLPTVEARQYAVIVAQVLLLALALSFLARSLDAELAALGPALAAILVCLATSQVPPFTAVLLPTCHTGAATLAAAVLGLLLRAERRRWWGPVLGALSLAGTASDLLFTVFVGGALLGLLGSAWLRRSALRHVTAVAWVVGGALAGWLAMRLLPFRAEAEEPFSPHPLEQTFTIVSAQLRTFDGRFHALAAAGLGALLLLATRCRSEGRRDAARALLGGIVATIAAIAVTGYVGGWSRYLAWPAEAGLFGLLLLAPHASSARVVALLGAAAALVLNALGAPAFTFPLEAPPSRWREEAACVDALAQREEARGVVAGYWETKPLALFSSLPLQPAQLLPSLEGAATWMTTTTWYREPSGYAVVVENGLDGARLDRQVPRRMSRYSCGRLTVRVYRGLEREQLERFVAANQPP